MNPHAFETYDRGKPTSRESVTRRRSWVRNHALGQSWILGGLELHSSDFLPRSYPKQTAQGDGKQILMSRLVFEELFTA
jgi:hypothetical protein